MHPKNPPVGRACLTPVALAIHLALAAMPSFGAGTVTTVQAQAAAPSAIQYDIPAGPLAEALNRFAQQSGIAVVVDAAKVHGLRTPGLKGGYAVDEGFAVLLRGSGYAASKTAAGYVLVPQPQAGDTPTLPTVKVSASAERSDLLPPPYAGGQMARGGRLGMLGNKDFLDAPFSLSSYTAQAIEDRQAVTVADVVVNDPSVRVSGQAGDILDTFFIRGFPVGDQNSGEIAFDGVYGVAPNYRVLTDYAERVEVVKGPTALLYGMSPANSVGGTINIVPKRAAATDLTRFTADYASDSQLGGHLDVSRRFGEDRRFGARFNGSYHDGDTPLDHQSRSAHVGALALDYQGERLRASADLIDQREDIDAPSRRPFLAAGVGVPSAPDGRRNVTQAWEWFKTEDQSLLLRAEYDLNDTLTLFAAAGGGRTRVDRLFGNPTILNAAGDTSTVPQHFKFDVDRSTADAGLRARFVTGAVGHGVTLQASRYRDRLGRNSVSGSAVASNLYHPVDRAEQSVAAPATVPKVSQTELSGVALADTLSMFDDRLQLTVGVRRQQVESDNFSPASGAVTSSYDKSAVTPLVGVVVKPWQNIAFYANRIEGLSKGDTAPGTAANAGEVFAPYRSRQNEIGVKIDHGRLATTVSVFEIEKPSGQLTGNVFAVDGEQRNRGLEIALFGEATRRVRLLGGVTLLDAELTKTNSTATQGKTAAGAPSLAANLGVEWDTPFAPGVTLTGNLVHTGKQYVDRANTQHIPAWTTLDLGARYRTTLAGQATTFRASLRNAFDRHYWAGVSQWGSLAQGAPRTLLLSATVDF